MEKPLPCPCGNPRDYADCCGRYHAGKATAPTAEALMRARYAAYVLDLHPYLLDTWHPDTRPSALAAAEPGLRWLGLDIRQTTIVDANHATVEFVARSKLGGQAHRLHEISRFVREGGIWLYVDGDVDPRAAKRDRQSRPLPDSGR